MSTLRTSTEPGAAARGRSRRCSGAAHGDAQRMTQEQLAKKAGVTQGYVVQFESGLKKNPSLPTLKKLARALGVPVTELLE
jgi:DNA-binding XRE family transcriptional regulator